MKYTVDDLNLDKVRLFLEDYYDAARFAGIPGAKEDYELVRNASDEELVEFLNKCNFNLSVYKKSKKK